MKFWDSSALVPLFVQQDMSDRVAMWHADDPAVAIGTFTPVEVVSAIRRMVRERAFDENGARTAEAFLDDLVRVAHVVSDIEAVKTVARRLLRVHALRAFDALQLAAALAWAEGRPEGRVLYTLDTRLALAARREGFVVPE